MAASCFRAWFPRPHCTCALSAQLPPSTSNAAATAKARVLLLLRLLLLATGAPRSRCLLLPASYRCTRMYNNCMPVHHAGKPVYRQTRQALLAAFCWLPLVLLLPLRSSFWLSHTYILTCSPTDTTGEQKSQDNANTCTPVYLYNWGCIALRLRTCIHWIPI